MAFLKNFRKDRGGNTAITFGLAAFPLIAVMGMTADYTMAGRRQTKINAIADAAALSTTTPTTMGLTAATAQANAVAMFNAQVASVAGVNYASNVDISVVDTTGASTTRTTTVKWNATSSNAFASLLNMSTMPIAGTSAVSNTTAPNIDFYVLLDTSPSMAIPSSQDGIDTMIKNTPQQDSKRGCAFACHHTYTTTKDSNGNNIATNDTLGNPKGSDGKIIDNYQLARNLGVKLRMDLVKSAVANLYKTAKSTEAANKAVYRVATYTFDQSFDTVTNLTADLDKAQSDANNNVDMLTVYSNGYLDSKTNNNDQDTQWDQAMANSQYMPDPGNGTNQKGDKPQEILFIVTDGVVDEAYPNFGPNDMTYGGRTITYPTYQKDYCTTVKNRGIRIAMLYTTYYPLPNNGFYNTYVDPFQPKISGKLQACASPGLFFEVNTGGDIDAAMQALFQKAVTTAHLIQ